MMNRVWVLGDAVIDLVPENANGYLKCPGGAPANVAVGIARLGGDSAFIGRVGQDSFGAFLQRVLSDEGVDIGHMRPDPEHHTSTVVVDLDLQGERSFTFMVQPSADLFLQPDDLPVFQRGEWLHLCSIALSQEPSRSAAFTAMERIRAAGGRVSFDPNIREEVWRQPEALRPCLQKALLLADVVKLSREELAFISHLDDLENAIRWMMQTYPLRLLLVTLGGDGVCVHDGQRLRHFHAPSIVPVDTTGAGDAFVAGLLAALARLHELPQEAQWPAVIAQAQACGALATTAKGAMTALPRADELAAFLR
ncbi:aminoimidazole riboside kinase [Serratia sp. CY49633]|uniref:aminoimidazole riboside kinase n=1 Tax=Serratia TaxID=613 RepID=UPI0007452A06|nr:MULTISPECIES: aminoimidazole riboside kinase [Serratia]AVD64755.1 aminoimidazole riboside kinase [Serratia marcescens]ELL0333845.1 aminoimidazole riboside kinase [Serratia marcescens]MBH2544528.1 aminoimidazole riboside kinase [Serratia marcescens]MBH2550126.1 aminoimidazole riboside kinase [Serratia marcescens]MBH2858362.1 aminoimidazole riboside kinase [Serratia marcescens]